MNSVNRMKQATKQCKKNPVLKGRYKLRLFLLEELCFLNSWVPTAATLSRIFWRKECFEYLFFQARKGIRRPKSEWVATCLMQTPKSTLMVLVKLLQPSLTGMARKPQHNCGRMWCCYLTLGHIGTPNPTGLSRAKKNNIHVPRLSIDSWSSAHISTPMASSFEYILQICSRPQSCLSGVPYFKRAAIQGVAPSRLQ